MHFDARDARCHNKENVNISHTKKNYGQMLIRPGKETKDNKRQKMEVAERAGHDFSSVLSCKHLMKYYRQTPRELLSLSAFLVTALCSRLPWLSRDLPFFLISYHRSTLRLRFVLVFALLRCVKSLPSMRVQRKTMHARLVNTCEEILLLFLTGVGLR